jgi:hypothetical protein
LQPGVPIPEKQTPQEKTICIRPVFVFAPADNLVIKPFEMVPKPSAQREPLASELPNIMGEHLITLDGEVQLGKFGDVPVAGLSIELSQQAIQARLSQFLENPQIEVDFKPSPTYYIILQGPGFDERVERRIIAPHDTVLDVLVTLEPYPRLASEKMWIARLPVGNAPDGIILPIDYDGICVRAETDTNHQILPGDRLYIKGQQSAKSPMQQSTKSQILTEISRPFRQTLKFISNSCRWRSADHQRIDLPSG